MANYEAIIQEEIDNLPIGFTTHLDHDMQQVVAVLRLHDFLIIRADDTKPFVDPDDDVYGLYGHPSVWFVGHNSKQLLKQHQKLIKEKPAPHDLELTKATNKLLRSHLEEQQRMLAFLEEFYRNRKTSFYTRLIVEDISHEGAYLKSQGATIRPLLDAKEQQSLTHAFTAELLAFAHFLANKL